MGTLCHISFEAVTAEEEEERTEWEAGQVALFMVDLPFKLIYGTAFK